MLWACDHTEPVPPHVLVASARVLLWAVTDGRVGSLPAQRFQGTFRSSPKPLEVLPSHIPASEKHHLFKAKA